MRLSMKRLTRPMVIYLLRQGWERRALIPLGTASLQLVKGIVRDTGWAAQEGCWDWYWNNCFWPHVRIRGTTSIWCERTTCVSASWHTASLRNLRSGIGLAEMGWSGVCNLGVVRAISDRGLYVSGLGVVWCWDIDVSLLRLGSVLQICAQLWNFGVSNINWQWPLVPSSFWCSGWQFWVIWTCQFVLRDKLIEVPSSTC